MVKEHTAELPEAPLYLGEQSGRVDCRDTEEHRGTQARMLRAKRSSPLRCEHPVEPGLLPVLLPVGLQYKHIADDVKGETVVIQSAEELGLQESCPPLL